MNYSKAQALGIRILLALGMLSVMAVAGVETPATVSAHGGDASMVHACVNDTNAETLIVHPGPGDATIGLCQRPLAFGCRMGPSGPDHLVWRRHRQFVASQFDRQRGHRHGGSSHSFGGHTIGSRSVRSHIYS